MHYSAAIDLVDDDSTFYTNLAAAHYALKDYANALKMAVRGVKLDGGNAKAHYRKAQALEGLGQLEDAKDAYEAGLGILPDSEQLRGGLASVSERLRASANVEKDALEKIKEMARVRWDKEVAKSPVAAKPAESKAAPAPAESGGRGMPASGAALKKHIKGLGRDSAKVWGYLSGIASDAVGKLLVSGLEEEELMSIVRACEEHGLETDAKHAWEVVRSLAGVPRVGITCMMLDRRDTTKLETLLLKLHPAKAHGAGHTVEEYAAMRKALGI